MHLLGHLLLTHGTDFTSHGSMFKDEIYQFLGCSSHGSNSKAHFLSLQMISASLHGSSFYCAVVYISDSVKCIVLLPKRKIPPDISNLFGFMGSPAHNQETVVAQCCKQQQKFSQVFSKFVFLLILRGGFPMRISLIFSVALSSILSFRLYLGDLWSCYHGPQLSKLGFRGVLGLLILPSPYYLLIYLT